VRYPIAGAVGVAGIIGFFKHLDRGDADPFTRDSLTVVPEEEIDAARARNDPTLNIRVGYERRIELADARSTTPGRLDSFVERRPWPTATYALPERIGGAR
jgi:hypothetical protein